MGYGYPSGNPPKRGAPRAPGEPPAVGLATNVCWSDRGAKVVGRHVSAPTHDAAATQFANPQYPRT